jgi:hypothetical protein
MLVLLLLLPSLALIFSSRSTTNDDLFHSCMIMIDSRAAAAEMWGERDVDEKLREERRSF